MLAFCFIIIFTLTYIKTQKAFQVKVNEGTEWNPHENFSTKTSGESKSFEKQLQKEEKIFGSLALAPLNLQEVNKKSAELGLEKNLNQTTDKKFVTPRFFHSRAQLDGGGLVTVKRDISRIKVSSFETPSTNIPLIETFRDQFLRLQSENGNNNSFPRDQIQNEVTSIMDKKEDSLKSFQSQNEKNITAKSRLSQPFNHSKFSDNLSQHTKQSNLIIVTPISNEKTILPKSKHMYPNSTSDIKNLTQNLQQGIFHNPEMNVQANFERASPGLPLKSKDEKLSTIPQIDSRSNMKSNVIHENNTMSRFRKQVLIGLIKKPSQAFNVARGVSPHTQHARYNQWYSAPSLELQEPSNGYPNGPQRVEYYYPPNREPIKSSYEPNNSQNFKPSKLDQNSYLQDRPPQDFEIFAKPNQQTNYYYGPPQQTYQPWKNNTLYEVPPQGYYYPSQSYHPGEIVLPTEQTIELTSQSSQPSETQTYPAPSSLYQYGVPETIQQTYGPPNQQTYGPPNQQTYIPPNLQTYGPPNQQFYVPPNQQTYGPPNQQTYGPPDEFSPIQAPKPYFPGSYSKIVLSDDQCVMSQEIVAEALVEVTVELQKPGNQSRNCALMFTSNNNIAVSSMIQDDGNATTTDLVKRMNLKMFSVQLTGHILEVNAPWYSEDKSPGLALGQSNNIIITLQTNISVNFRLLISSYKNITPQIPVIQSFLLTANATTPLNETELMEGNGQDSTVNGKVSPVPQQTFQSQLFFVQNPR